MATTYHDTYSLTDVIDSSTYTSNSTRITTAVPVDPILQDGMTQKALYDILYDYVTKWNLALAAMDADGGINTATFVTNGTLGTLDATYGIFPNGIDQPDLVTLLTAIETKFEVVTALLDADDTLTDTNYASLWDFDMDTTKIKSTGISQGAVVDYLETVIAALDGVLVKLDADLA